MDEITVKVVEVAQRTESNTHRIDKLEERQDNLDRLVSSVATLATEQEHIKVDVTEIKTDVKALTERPAKRWDAVITAVITSVIGIFIGLLLRGVV